MFLKCSMASWGLLNHLWRGSLSSSTMDSPEWDRMEEYPNFAQKIPAVVVSLRTIIRETPAYNFSQFLSDCFSLSGVTGEALYCNLMMVSNFNG